MHDSINHPRHYTSHPSGIECIQITEHMNFNVGNAIKCLWRANDKNGIEDLQKAAWYVNREIERLRGERVNPNKGGSAVAESHPGTVPTTLAPPICPMCGQGHNIGNPCITNTR